VVLFILQSKPFRDNIAPPLALLLPWASSNGAPHLAFYFFSLSRVECVLEDKLHMQISNVVFLITQTSYIQRQHFEITRTLHKSSSAVIEEEPREICGGLLTINIG